jgi:alkylhydroperoxidase family enzyme
MRRGATALMVGGAALVVPGLASAAGAAELFYERAVMSAADERCNLFTPPVSAALEAARAQARGAALRGGAEAAELQLVQARARRKAASVSCTSPDMRTAAQRVRIAFDGYARLYRMSFPGDVAAWKAERIMPERGEGWRLSQFARFGSDKLNFGLAAGRGQPGRLTGAVIFADNARPFAARIVIRDVTRTSAPYLGDARGGPTARLPLDRRVAPRSAARAFLAESRATDVRLSPDPGETATVFRFPAAAAAAIAGLDPREAVSVEFVFAGRSRDVVRTAYLEVGDFAAAQAFLTVASR